MKQTKAFASLFILFALAVIGLAYSQKNYVRYLTPSRVYADTTQLQLKYNIATGSADFTFRGAAKANTFNILDNGTLNFQRSPGGDAGLSSTLFLSAAGNVGIGTTSPAGKLEIGSGQLLLADGSGGAPAIGFTSNPDVGFWIQNSSQIKVAIDSSTVWTFYSSAFGGNSSGDAYIRTNGVGSGLTYQFVGDSNTGITWVSADTMALHTGGSERLRIDSTGNVGIGTTGPSSKLDITTAGLGTTQTTSSGLALVNTTAAAAGAQQISPALRWSGFGWKTDAAAASQAVDFRAFVTPVQGAAAPTGYLGFESSINGGAYSATPPFVITTGGNIGIGTTGPQSKLHVNDGTNLNLGIQAVSSEMRISSFNDAGTQNNPLRFQANAYKFFNNQGNTQIVTIDNTGNVGIGTTSPSVALDVTGSASISATLTVGNGGTIRPQYGPLTLAYKSALNSWTSGITLQDTTGNVGIGNTAPSRKLVVNGDITATDKIYGGSSSTNIINLYNNGISAESYQDVLFQLDNDNNDTSEAFSVVTNAATSQLFYIKANGNVGIGTATPAQKLDVSGDLIIGSASTRWKIFSYTNKTDCDTASGTQTAICFDSNDDAGTSELRLQASGNLVHAGTIASSGDPDIAEQIPVNDVSIEEGDLLTAANPAQLPSARIYDNVLAEKSTQPYQFSLIGVVSTNPTMLIGEENAMELPDEKRVINGNRRAMALSGRIPMKVSTINGPIHAGDPLTSSPLPGVGMKATQAGPIIGRALQSYTNPDKQAIEKIVVLLNLSWFDPDMYRIETSGLRIQSDHEGAYALRDANDTVINRIGGFAELVTAKLTAGFIEAKRVVVNGVDMSVKITELEEKIKRLEQRIDALESAPKAL